MGSKKKPDRVNKGRRRFMGLGITLGAGLVVGVYLGSGGENVKSRLQVWDHVSEGLKANAWVHIGIDERVTVMVNHTEMGQGISTALPMILAEELAADWSRVHFLIAPAEEIYKNPEYGIQLTAGSTSVTTSWNILRQAGAQARDLLVLAAARQWGVPAEQCQAIQGRVEHPASGKSLTYGKLALAAASLEPPKGEVRSKPGSYQIVGKSLPRLDAADKISGRAIYGMDVNLPGMLLATVIHPPIFKSGLKDYKLPKDVELPGFDKAVPISSGLALVGSSFWGLQKAREAIQVSWEGGVGALDSDDLFKRWQMMSSEEGNSVLDKGDASQALSSGGLKTLRAEYMLPFQAHAAPEPMNCTARVTGDSCEVWAPTQNQDMAQEAAARLCGLPYESVTVHTPYVGGAFGRRAGVDYVVEAVELALALGAPVKVMWTREEDMQHDLYRPACYNLVEAGLDAGGRLTTWRHRIVGPDHGGQSIPEMFPSVIPYWLPRGARDAATWLGHMALPKVLSGQAASEGANPPYDIANVRVEHLQDDPGVPLGFWRSVAHSTNAFVVECFIDEIAGHLGQDPLEFRKKMLDHDQVAMAALKGLEDIGAWPGKPNPGIARGLALHDFHGARLACVAEVAKDGSRSPQLLRVICTVECGEVVNPRIAEAQVRGGIIFGLSAALKSSITIKNGRVQETNFSDFPIMRMDDTPPIEVHFVPSGRHPHGLGETGVPVIGPALANAYFAATGKRIRTLPLG